MIKKSDKSLLVGLQAHSLLAFSSSSLSAFLPFSLLACPPSNPFLSPTPPYYLQISSLKTKNVLWSQIFLMYNG